MEFKLINPQNESGFIQAIEFNFDELKAELSQRLEKYKNLKFTEETAKEAKETRAGLNKFKEAIETRRKEIKALCLKPYNDFEIKVKELTALIDEPIKQISTQLDTFENNRITAKKEEITKFFNENIADLKDIVSLDKIFNPKWINSTYKMTTIQGEIIEKIGKIKGDLAVITDLKLDSDFELQVKDKYLQTFDFSLAMAEKTRLETLKKAINVQKSEQQDEEPEKKENKEEPQQVTHTVENITPIKPEKIYYKEFWVKGTKQQLMALGDYLKANNIIYGGIEKCQSQIA